LSSTLFLLTIVQWLQRRFFGSDRIIKKRLADVTHDKEGFTFSSDIPFIIRDNQLSKIPIFNRILLKLSLSKKLRHLLEQADVKNKVGEIILMMLVLGILGGFITQFYYSTLISTMVAGLTACLPLFYVLHRRNKRLNSFDREFPDAIDMISSAIRSGHAFNRAIQLVGEEAPDPVGTEFKRIFDEYGLGLPIKEALTNLAKRIDSTALKIFITAVLLQKETGGNLSEILEKISITIRERFKLAGQIKIYSAQSRLSAWVIGGLPIGFLIIVSFINPNYIDPLFEDSLGHTFLVIAFCLQLVGFLFIKKIVHIKRF
jgi:tight adherence protein B